MLSDLRGGIFNAVTPSTLKVCCPSPVKLEGREEGEVWTLFIAGWGGVRPSCVGSGLACSGITVSPTDAKASRLSTAAIVASYCCCSPIMAISLRFVFDLITVTPRTMLSSLPSVSVSPPPDPAPGLDLMGCFGLPRNCPSSTRVEYPGVVAILL